MKKNFTQLFEIIKNKFILEHKGKDSLPALAEFLGHGHKGKVTAWSNGQWPNAQDCWMLHRKMGFTLEWLLTGEGEMLRCDKPQPEQASGATPGSITPFPVPVVGLAACGVEGIEQVMPYAVTASPVLLGPRSVAVVASGESMVPAGIASGHMCFCDPDQMPLPGEAVFFKRKDDKGALKLFLGKGKRKGYTTFKGWLPSGDGNGQQKEFIMDVLDEGIDYIAPIVFVRRRL